MRLPFRPGAFDVILAAHLFEHVHDWQRAVRGWLVHLTDTGRLVFLVTPGFMATGPRSAMRRELRARGADLRRVGAASVASVAQWCAEQGHTVTHRASPAWSWTRTVPVAQSIRFLERRVYSAFWHVPDRLYDDALAGVRREFQDRMNHSESHDARCEYWEVRPPSTGHREGIPKNAEVLAVDRAQRRDRVGGRT